MGKKSRRRAVTGDEADVFGSWRRMYCYLQRPGATSKVKRRARRRERREGKQEARGDW